MSTMKHNKKRNTGLVFYEFFSRYIGQAILEGRDSDVNKARGLLRKHFNKGTDLYKELKLFKALFETRNTSREAAVYLIGRVRDAVKVQSQAKLDLEKTSLILEVNTLLGDERFFNRNIAEYKTFATIQLLLNNWRSLELNEAVGDVVSLEEKLIEYLTTNTIKPKKLENVSSMTEQDVDRLVVNLMTEKVNAKFGDLLDEEQKKILQLYVFSNDNKSMEELTSLLETIKQKALCAIKQGKTEFFKDKVMIQKLDQFGAMLNEHSELSSPTDDLISFYLGVSTFRKEIASDD